MRVTAMILLSSVLLLGCSAHADEAPLEPDPDPVETAEPEPDPEPVAHAPLTGIDVFEEDEAATLAERPAVAVKIPNDRDARPQSGLEAADVVYEQETEHGVTRFTAIFQSQWPDVVGNVRSARAVDVPIVAPYDGLMVYSGARQENRQRIADVDLTTVTEGGPGMFRDADRPSPHNLFVRLPQAAASRSAPPADTSPWRFGEQQPGRGQSLSGRVTVPVSGTSTTGWDYDDEAEVFRRLQDGQSHEVAGSGRIGAANVVVLGVEVSGRDSHGAPVYELDGSGPALLLRDGRAFGVSWAKDGVRGPLRLEDGSQDAILKPGPTWVLLTYGDALERVGGLG